jgi:GDPmannose 4,6-dehydratase
MTPSVGDPTKARTVLGWEPQVPFEQLVERMVAADLRSLRAAATPS